VSVVVSVAKWGTTSLARQRHQVGSWIVFVQYRLTTLAFFIMDDKASPAPAIIVAEARKRRWERLNEVLGNNKRAKPIDDSRPSVDCSYVNWKQVENIFPRVSVAPIGDGPSRELPEADLNALYTYLTYASTCFRSVYHGREAKRLHFIAPVLIFVCAHFHGDVEIIAEEDIRGKRVRAHGHFEFVLKRGDRYICIVQATEEKIEQGITQSLLGCESFCDIKGLDVAYGISTNFIEWCFVKNEADKINCKQNHFHS
jgi:hypothetical protein